MILADVDSYDETVGEASMIRTKSRANGVHRAQEAKISLLQNMGWYPKYLGG